MSKQARTFCLNLDSGQGYLFGLPVLESLLRRIAMLQFLRITLISALLLSLPTAALATGMEEELFDEPVAATAEPLSEVKVPNDTSAEATRAKEGCTPVDTAASQLAETTSKVAVSNYWECPSAFDQANFCSGCYTAYNQCNPSSTDCYACLETCLARLGCWIP